METLRKTNFLRKHKWIALILTLALIILLYFKTESNGSSNIPRNAIVEEVIDGDTIILSGVDPLVRYVEINAPEIFHEDSPGDPFSEEAKNLNKKLVLGKRVKLEFDKEKYDDYGRILAYVYVDSVFVNKKLVEDGLAQVFIKKPNDKYKSVIHEAEKKAKQERKGIWGSPASFSNNPKNERFLIKPSEASRYVNRRVVVRGKVTDSRKSKNVISLKMEDALNIVIFLSDWENFEFFNIPLDKYYLNKKVEVIGRVKIYKGMPEILAGHPIVIRTLK